jgi:hypothetical protein
VRLVAFAAWSLWLEFRGGRCQPVILEGFLDSPCGGGADAPVDRVCLVQQFHAFVVAAILEVCPAESFQGPCFFQGCADIAGDG